MEHRITRYPSVLLSLIGFLVASGLALPMADAQTSTGKVPLSELGSPYLGSGEPGLYPGGSNSPSGGHLAYGQTRIAAITPRDASGAPDPNGVIGFVSVGMSNTNQEWSPFERAVDTEGAHWGRVVLVNLAVGGIAVESMGLPTDLYWTTFVPERLQAMRVAPAQVQVAWVKQSLQMIPGAGWPGDTQTFQDALRLLVGEMRAQFPNLQVIYFSTRVFGLWAGVPEPISYEMAWGVKWLIDEQIVDLAGSAAGLGSGPWLAWGPYLWADGDIARADGLTWLRADFEMDGTHPGPTGEAKVGQLLHDFFTTAPEASGWFLPHPGTSVATLDVTDDAVVDAAAPGMGFGTGTELQVGPGRRVYLRFDLSGVSQPIVHAKLSLMATPTMGGTGGSLFVASSSAWSEATLTFASAPALVMPQANIFPRASRGGSPSGEVTAQAQQAVAAGGLLTLVLQAPGGGSGSYLSHESGVPPRLVLTFATPLLCGDCNLDSQVSIIDALAAAQHGVGLITLAGSAYSQCNVTGVLEPDPAAAVNVLDSLYIAQVSAGLPVVLVCQ